MRCARNPAGMSRDDQEFWGHLKAEAFPQYVDAGDADDEDDDDECECITAYEEEYL